MANISRNLYITSKDQLYKIIDQNEELSSNRIFIPFIDAMMDHYYGCRCNESIYDTKSNDEYDKLDNEEAIKLLKDFFNCEIVKFTK